MKIKTLLWLSGFALLSPSLSLAAPSEEPQVHGDAVDAELASLMALQGNRPSPETRGAAYYLWFDKLCQKIGNGAFDFIAKHPNDPRRWKAALLLQQRRYQPRFVKSIGDDYDQVGEKAVVRDKEAEDAWENRVAALEKELRSAADVPVEVREQLAFGDFMEAFMPQYKAVFEKQPADIAFAEKTLKAFLASWPESESGRSMVSMVVNMRRALGQGDEKAVLKDYADSPNRSAREYVKARLDFFAKSEKPFELAFTALDGRQVDLQALRGKVVLIDFWATWCGPCIQELPNVKKTYAEYHDKGFEVIGISLDSEKDRAKFKELVAKEGVVWPQRFEGKGWNDSLALEYTITGIPAMFLLGKDGKLVSTNARGEKLGAEVRRLLGL